MRLLTQNMLQCHVRDCKKDNFPLKIESSAPISNQVCEFNRDFILNMLLRIDYVALLQALEDIKLRQELQMPDQLPEDLIAKADVYADLIKKLHKALMELHIQTGQMVCNNCRRVYKIENGIPNMVLSEDEV